MKIAVINSGSSSLKFKLFDGDTQELISSKIVQNIGEKNSKIQTHHDALKSLEIDFASLDIIAHRVVHGGDTFKNPIVINDAIIEKIERLSPLAPLHNPANIEGMKVVLKHAPEVKQVAVFDTAFHANMPKAAFLYALPYHLYEKHKIRKYGFHGTSHAFVSKRASQILGKNLEELNLISLHLGNGASACAIEKGVSIDTSMGFTPLEGLVMGSRCGDIDAAIIPYLQKEVGLSIASIEKLLNNESGLLGLSGENDVRSLLAATDAKSALALEIMTRRVKKYIGAYMALLGRVDALIFTGGIGENSAAIREQILDSSLFENIKILVIKTDEELEIALECLRV